MAYTLEETPTWAVAAVCTLIVLVSLIVERLINLVGKVRILVCHIYSEMKYIMSLRPTNSSTKIRNARSRFKKHIVVVCVSLCVCLPNYEGLC